MSKMSNVYEKIYLKNIEVQTTLDPAGFHYTDKMSHTSEYLKVPQKKVNQTGLMAELVILGKPHLQCDNAHLGFNQKEMQ